MVHMIDQWQLHAHLMSITFKILDMKKGDEFDRHKSNLSHPSIMSGCGLSGKVKTTKNNSKSQM